MKILLLQESERIPALMFRTLICDQVILKPVYKELLLGPIEQSRNAIDARLRVLTKLLCRPRLRQHMGEYDHARVRLCEKSG